MSTETSEKTSLRDEIRDLLNSRSKENGSDTPDWILAEFLLDSLEAFDRATNMRSRWYGHTPWGDDSAWKDPKNLAAVKA